MMGFKRTARWLRLVSLCLLTACDTHHYNPQQPSYLFDANDLDLQTITAHIKAGGGEVNAGALEQWVNSTPGINNVDIDKDGRVDLLTIREVRGDGDHINLEVTANPATGNPVVVTTLQFSRAGGTTYIEAGYPSYVNGGGVTYREPLINVAFSAWLWAPRPVYYYPVTYYRSVGWYQPRPIYQRQELVARREQTRRTTVVAPVVSIRSTTNNYNGPPPQAAARRPAPAPTTSISDSAGKGSNFSVRSQSTPQTAPKSFGARESAPAAARPTAFRSTTSRPSAPSRGSAPRSVR